MTRALKVIGLLLALVFLVTGWNAARLTIFHAWPPVHHSVDGDELDEL